MIRVLIVDDHAIVRDGVCALLGLTPDIEVVGEAANGMEALEIARKLNPDVVLVLQYFIVGLNIKNQIGPLINQIVRNHIKLGMIPLVEDPWLLPGI